MLHFKKSKDENKDLPEFHVSYMAFYSDGHDFIIWDELVSKQEANDFIEQMILDTRNEASAMGLDFSELFFVVDRKEREAQVI